MYTSTTRYEYRDLAIQRGKRLSNVAKFKSFLPSFYELLISSICVITLVGYFTT